MSDRIGCLFFILFFLLAIWGIDEDGERLDFFTSMIFSISFIYNIILIIAIKRLYAFIMLNLCMTFLLIFFLDVSYAIMNIASLLFILFIIHKIRPEEFKDFNMKQMYAQMNSELSAIIKNETK